jgi:hypothetical protein
MTKTETWWLVDTVGGASHQLCQEQCPVPGNIGGGRIKRVTQMDRCGCWLTERPDRDAGIWIADKVKLAARAIVEIKDEARRKINLIGFDVGAQASAIREGRTDDPRFAEIDAIREWAHEEERKINDKIK